MCQAPLLIRTPWKPFFAFQLAFYRIRKPNRIYTALQSGLRPQPKEILHKLDHVFAPLLNSISFSNCHAPHSADGIAPFDQRPKGDDRPRSEEAENRMRCNLQPSSLSRNYVNCNPNGLRLIGQRAGQPGLLG